jgi:hypothetical protein
MAAGITPPPSTLDENGDPLGDLIGFNSSFIEVCRTRANLCR